MAGLTSIASFLIPFAGKMLVDDHAQDRARSNLRAQQGLALQQLQAQQDQDMSRAQADAALERDKIAAQAQSAEETRRAALKRAVARQRATFGASGIDTASSGSAQAVLLGLFDESEAEKAQREKLDTLRLGAIDQDLGQRNSLNILQRTQLAQQQQLQQSINSSGKGKEKLLSRFFDIF